MVPSYPVVACARTVLKEVTEKSVTMTEPEVANDTDLDEEVVTNGKKSKEENSKNKRNVKKKTTENESEEEDAEVLPSKNKRGTKKEEKNSTKPTTNVSSKKGKVPLLDQPTIVEGSRNRKTVVQFESKITVTKFSPIEIPKGKGTPLGQIPNINGRMKRLRQNVLKEFHKFLFGKCGNPANFIINLQKFCGFPVEKESDPYNRKLSLLNKFPMDDIKELLYFLDLNLKYKKKDEAVRRVLDFLILPDISNTEQSQPTGHPKRRATKRNYEDAEIDEADRRKKKKQPTAPKSASEDSDAGKIEENGKNKSRRRTKNSSESETNTVDEDDQKDESDAEDEDNEIKKPAKKRKRQPIVEESKGSSKETKNQKKKTTGKQNNKKKRKQDEETTKSESEVSADEEEPEEQKKTDLTDEELKSFLQSVLANANLEETTMKTVYGLINTHYPDYNFSKKKDFIKDIVKSLLQSS